MHAHRFQFGALIGTHPDPSPLPGLVAAQVAALREQAEELRDLLRDTAEEPHRSDLAQEIAETEDLIEALLEPIRRTQAYADLPYWSEGTFRLLWHVSYWNGPMSGLLEKDGRKYWFEMLSDAIGDCPRAFAVIELSAQELADEEERHDRFRMYVGTHCDYDAEGNRSFGEVRPEGEWHRFYDSERLQAARDVSQKLVIAWFDSY